MVGRLAVCAFIAVTFAMFAAVGAMAADNSGVHARQHGHHGGSAPGRMPGHRYFRPEIGVGISPQTEHWPSNAVPRGYQLRDYGGHPDAAHICRGASGMTIGTGSAHCPPGQHPSKGGRRWSTGD